MATSIARLRLPALSADSERRRLGCVLCNKLRPSNGKILHCLHISCLDCIGEMKDDDGYLKCIECLAASDACLSTGNVSNKLVNSVPMLYASRAVEDLSSKTPSAVKQFCELCDDDAPGEATHKCEECEGMLLCTKHAKSHTKVRVYSEHTVESLGEISADSFQPSSTHCIFHNRLNVVTYCLTCCHGVCAQCLANGHEDHIVRSLQATAKQRCITVEEMVNSSPVISLSIESESGEAAGSSQLPVEAALHDISEEINSIEKEAEAASCIVTETIGKIETMLKAKKEKLLRCVDQLRWSQLDVYESKQQRLFALQEKHATLVQLSQQLIDGKVPDTDSILLADIVTSSHDKIATEMQSEQSTVDRQKIVVSSNSLDTITHNLDALLSIRVASSNNAAVSDVEVVRRGSEEIAVFDGATPAESTTIATFPLASTTAAGSTSCLASSTAMGSTSSLASSTAMGSTSSLASSTATGSTGSLASSTATGSTSSLASFTTAAPATTTTSTRTAAAVVLHHGGGRRLRRGRGCRCVIRQTHGERKKQQHLNEEAARTAAAERHGRGRRDRGRGHVRSRQTRAEREEQQQHLKEEATRTAAAEHHGRGRRGRGRGHVIHQTRAEREKQQQHLKEEATRTAAAEHNGRGRRGRGRGHVIRQTRAEREKQQHLDEEATKNVAAEHRSRGRRGRGHGHGNPQKRADREEQQQCRNEETTRTAAAEHHGRGGRGRGRGRGSPQKRAEREQQQHLNGEQPSQHSRSQRGQGKHPRP